MIVVLTLMGCCLILFVLVLVACVKIEHLQAEAREDHTADHAKCIAAVAAFVGNDFAARVLDSAASDYGQIEGQADLIRIRNLYWVEGGPSIPALWMRDRADSIRGYSVDLDEEDES